MEYLICYDIVEDGLRFDVADVCMNNGFTRIQYSVFFGNVSRNKAENALMEIKDKIRGHDAAILFVELCDKCAKKKKIIISVSKTDNNNDKAVNSVDSFSHSDNVAISEKSTLEQQKASTSDGSSTNDHEINNNEQKTKKKRKRKSRASLERLSDLLNKGVVIL